MSAVGGMRTLGKLGCCPAAPGGRVSDTGPAIFNRLQQRLDRATVRGGLVATFVALAAGVLTRDSSWSAPMWLLVGAGLLFVWYVLTAIGRLVLIRAKDTSLPAAFWHWWGARLALLFSASILFFCWLMALPAGNPWSGIAGRALMLLLILNLFVGLIGYATLNSVLLFERLRRRDR